MPDTPSLELYCADDLARVVNYARQRKESFGLVIDTDTSCPTDEQIAALVQSGVISLVAMGKESEWCHDCFDRMMAQEAGARSEDAPTRMTYWLNDAPSDDAMIDDAWTLLYNDILACDIAYSVLVTANQTLAAFAEAHWPEKHQLPDAQGGK